MMTNRTSITAAAAMAAALLLAACELLPSDDTSTTPGTNTPTTPTTEVPGSTTPGTNTGSTTPTTVELPESDFARNSDGSWEGTAYVVGYTTTEQRTDPNCVPGPATTCATHYYVKLMPITGTAQAGTALRAFMDEMAGNAYAGPDFIGIGCLEGTELVYSNGKNLDGSFEEHSVGESETTSIMAATSAQPAIIKLDRSDEEASSTGAPACYSHFSDISLEDDLRD